MGKSRACKGCLTHQQHPFYDIHDTNSLVLIFLLFVESLMGRLFAAMQQSIKQMIINLLSCVTFAQTMRI